MTTLREAAQQALEALESADWYINQLEQIVYSDDDTDTHKERAKVQAAVTALRAALAEPVQEPVAWELRKGKTDRVLIEITNNPQRAHDWKASLEEVVPLYGKESLQVQREGG